jgi:hypothetical protein
MALKTVKIRPGVVTDDTSLATEGTYADAQWVRFRNNQWEVIGGWEQVTADTYTGLARGAWSWQDIDGNKILAWGTASKLYARINGTILDITPYKGFGTLVAPFTTVSGSAVVTVEHSQHGFKTGDSVTFTNAAAVGGITPSGAYTITVTTPNKYTITHGSNASSSATGGGNPDYSCPIDAGTEDGTAGSPPSTWSLGNWGENLIACRRGGPIYEWQPALSYAELITNGNFATNAGWGFGGNWSWDGANFRAQKTTTPASNLTYDIETLCEGGKTYILTATITNTAGPTESIEIGVNAGLVSPGIVDVSVPITGSGTFTRLITMPAEPLDLVFQATSSWTGHIDNVSLKLYDDAYRIETAPAQAQGIVVASDRTVIAYGTVEADGDYNPLLLRWSDRENNKIWIAASDNVAGEIQMGIGGKAVAGLAAREQNLFWTDGAFYALIPDADTVYRLVLLGEGDGAIGPLAPSSFAGYVFWINPQGKARMALSSVSDLSISQSKPIESGVEKYIFSNIAANQEYKITSFVNPQFNEVWFLYPDTLDGDEVSRAAIFNWVEGHWSVTTITRTTMITSGIEQYPIGFGTDNKIYYHEKGKSANGGTLSAYIETGDFDLEDGEFLAHIRRMVPDFEDQTGTITVTLYSRPWPQASRVTHGPYSFTTTTQKVDMRATGRIFAVRFAMSATSISARCGALRFDLERTGQRR